LLELIEHPEKRKQLAAEATQFVEKMDWTAKKHEYLNLVDDSFRTISRRQLKNHFQFRAFSL